MINQTNDKVNPIKTVIALLIPFVELGLGSFFNERVSGQFMKATVATGFGLIAFLLAIYLFKDVLGVAWHKYRKHIWRNLGLSLLGTIACYAILSVVRSGMTALNLLAPVTTPDVLSLQTAATGVYASLPVLMAPWTEEIVFRHAMFYQFKSKGKLVYWLLFFVQAILFGLIHWFNFNGQIMQMVPYMVIGAWFGLMYTWGKNIWFNIFSHFFFDIMTPLAAVALLIVTMFNH